ncbi:protein kinase domain-containing protein [Piscirickettsia salmonis]|uniref:protein kinase domain-containing protein n=1 Tax=Piscirickettsia salmonis TaxID=1238 RepID=UPI0007C994DD|nr:Protein kinase domain protein [Piscirickettsiaceae bacterium NZ-RLO1]
MPKVIWLAQESRTAEQQQAMEWRIAKKHLTGKPSGTQLNPKSGKKKKAYEDPETGENITLTHRYLVGGEGEIFVKSNGQALGQGICGEVTFGQTEDGRMWAIKESSTKPKNSQEGEIAVDLGKAKNYFKYQGKHYQIYHFLGTPLDKYLKEVKQSLTQAQQYDLAIKMARAVYYLHTGKYSKEKVSYAHLDLKPENFCIDDSGEVHLIDYGFSEVLPGKLDNEIKGSPAYLPFSVAAASKEELDIIALLRSLYLPPCFNGLGKVRSREPAAQQLNMQWIFSSATLNQDSALSQLLDTTKGEVVNLSALDITCQLILLKYDLHSSENLEKIAANPQQFEQDWQLLESLGLNQAAYLKCLLEQPDLINVFKERANKFLKLNKFGLNQAVYIEKVLDNPEQFDRNYQCLKSLGLNQATYLKCVLDQGGLINIFKNHTDKFLKLNQHGLNQSIYIEKALDNIEQFTLHYQHLKELELDQPPYVQKMLDHPEKFDQHYQQLVGLGLNQQPYVQKALDDPSVIPQLEKNKNEFLKLNRIGLNKPVYIEQILTNTNQFTRHYQCLINARLDSPHNIENILNFPEQFEQGYQHLKAFGLDQTNYIGSMLNHLPPFNEHCQQLKNLGLSQANNLTRLLNFPERFEKDLPSLLKLRKIYDDLSNGIISDHFKVRGLFAGGITINCQGQSKLVPRGIGNIWLAIANEQGDFYWMEDVNAALIKSTDQARTRSSARQQEEGQTPNLFFATYRDPKTQAVYDRISQLP